MMKRFSAILAAGLVTLAPCLGCHTRNTGDGSFAMTFGTTLTFSHNGPEEGESQVGIDVEEWMRRPVIEWLVDDGQSIDDEQSIETDGE